MNEAVNILTVTGRGIEPWLDYVADLRIQVFREFPYLYDGSRDYERSYLRTYVQSDTSIFVLAMLGEWVVGVSTGLALSEAPAEFREPVEATGDDVDALFYCGESVLLPEYRGLGLYRNFFEARETHARQLHKTACVFCAVQRPDDHPLRPADYQPLDSIWRHFGYEPVPEWVARFRWKDIDEPHESEKALQFYRKAL